MLQVHLSIFLFAAIIFGPSSPLSAKNNESELPACEIGGDIEFPCLAIVQHKRKATLEQGETSLQKVKTRFLMKMSRAAAIVIPDVKTLQSLMDDESVQALVPDRPIFAIAKKGGNNPPAPSQQIPEGVKSIGAAPGILSVAGKDIGIAVVDTGVDLKHLDLNFGSSCFSAFSDCQDRHGHGTHVAGIIGALDNGIDVVGVAPQATIYAVKSLDDRGSGSDSSLIAGLNWIAENTRSNALSPPIYAVNMSLGRFGHINDNPILRESIADLTNNLGISVIVAAGNDPGFEISDMVPASYPEVFAVASTTAISGTSQCRGFPYPIAASTASFFTTDGPEVLISAPGADSENISRQCTIASQGILSLKPSGGTARMSGTSMAAPHVTGVVALLNSKFDLSVEEVRERLQSSAKGFGVTPLDSPVSVYSFDGIREGVVSACRALEECH